MIKNKILIIIQFVIAFVFFQQTLLNAETMKLASPEYAMELCKRWNSSKLPNRLATKEFGGSGWIDISTTKRVPKSQPSGYQKIVTGRSDCKPEWPKIELVIERQKDGTAVCTSAGKYTGEKVTWQFLPKTKDFFNYHQGFELSIWKLDSKGDYDVKMDNKENFKLFFDIIAELALESDYVSDCEGVNVRDVIKAKAEYLQLTKAKVEIIPNAEYKLGDPQFAKALCASWNNSPLTKILGSEAGGGNGWVDSIVKHNVPEPQPMGYQKIVSGRSDCYPEWPKFEMVIERQDDGRALCTSAGEYDGKRVTWLFLPSSADWFYFKNGFELSLWKSNTIGDFVVSMKNAANFKIFFDLASDLALKSDYFTGCGEMNIGKVEKARNVLLDDKKNKK